MDSKTMKTVYTVVERGQGKSFWTRVGVGFVNHDGSINLRLDAVPVNGTLQVRDWEPPPERRAEGGAPFPARGGHASGPGEGDGARLRRREPAPARDSDPGLSFPGDALV